MNLKDSTKTTQNSLSFISLKFGMAAVFIGLLLAVFSNNHKQYSPGNLITKEDNDADAAGMAQFFFNARKNIRTNQLDYQSMIAADIADRAMTRQSRMHSSSTLTTMFNWISKGPQATGGRTRAILIDKNDPTHQTVFAGGVSGGIWKSLDGGSHWDSPVDTITNSLDDTLANINVSCIAQDANGVIYIGTGESFAGSQMQIGGGIFKSSDDGLTWSVILSTVPTWNSNNAQWSYVNRIAVNPTNALVIYAATNGGLFITHDGGLHWANCLNSVGNTKLNGASPDVKISNDGSIVITDVGGYGYTCLPQAGPDSVFTKINYKTAGKLPNGASRIEFAISPTDPNRIFASDIANNGSFGANASSGIFMTMNAKTNGGYWFDIGPGGSRAFDPYIEPGSTPITDQAIYDNAMAVSPYNEAACLVGGTYLYEWDGANTSDSVGAWVIRSSYFNLIHPDMHTIAYDDKIPGVIYLGCDGGIYKSTANGIQSSWQAYNKNYNVSQYYTICFSPQINPMNGEGIGGGTQDNGSPYITGVGAQPYYGTDLTGGDGTGCATSVINPNIGYFGIDYGTSFVRYSSYPTRSGGASAYTKTLGKGQGGDIDSVAQVGGGNFVFPTAMYENIYDTLIHDTVPYVSSTTHNVGDTIWPICTNGTYPYILKKTLLPNDTLWVKDAVVSRVAVGFSGNWGVWINGQGVSSRDVVWKPIGGPFSKPTAFSGQYPVTVLSWSPDGDALFVGTYGGVVFRFSNINALYANTYNSGAQWYKQSSSQLVQDDSTVVSTQLSVPNARDILSIAVDPKNGNNILVTMGNYGEIGYVYYSTNALSATPTFVSVQGTGPTALPEMPVYSSILDLDSAGTFLAGSAMVGTEHGIYTTAKLNGASTKWIKNSNGLANVITMGLKQQTMPNFVCNNSGNIYAGTFGRGVWVSNDYYQAPSAVPTIAKSSALNNLTVYPNPMTNEGNIEFDLNSADKVTLTIYNIQGKEVQTMNLGMQSPGNHKVPFDVSTLGSGTYFASLTGSDFKKTSKFIVVK